MPNYVYRAKGSDCSGCGPGLHVFHGMSEEGPKECPSCGRSVYRAITASAEMRTDNMHIDGGYFSQLARFPGDPFAHVSGRDDLRRKLYKGQKEGRFEIVKPSEDYGLESPRSIKQRERRNGR